MGVEAGFAVESSVTVGEFLAGEAEPESFVSSGLCFFGSGRKCVVFARARLAIVGFIDGGLLGLEPILGIADGRRDGTEDGAIEGIWDGRMEGSRLVSSVGNDEGMTLIGSSFLDGRKDGTEDGTLEGRLEGCSLGAIDGICDGRLEGS